MFRAFTGPPVVLSTVRPELWTVHHDGQQCLVRDGSIFGRDRGASGCRCYGAREAACLLGREVRLQYVVSEEPCWHPPVDLEPIRQGDDVPATKTLVRLDSQTLSCKHIDYGEGAKPPPLSGGRHPKPTILLSNPIVAFKVDGTRSFATALLKHSGRLTPAGFPNCE